MKKTLLLALALLLVSSSLVLASGSSGGGAAPTGAHDPLLVTESILCVVTDIDKDVVLIRDKGHAEQTPRPLTYTAKTKFRAQNKNDFDGRKKLNHSDLKVDHVLKVTMVADTGKVLSVMVLKNKET